ncbi:MAG: DUF4153 domain-containing protein [Candidatus Kapaibacterium sp.]
MKFPSLRELVESTRDTVFRFPLVLFSACAFALMLWTAIDKGELFDAGHIMAAVLGIALFFSIDLFAERRELGKTRWVLALLAAILLVGYGLWLGQKPEDNIFEIYRFGLFVLVVHFLVPISGFIRVSHLNQFWEFNKTLFLRLLLSLLFSGVLFGGLAVALLAIDHLLLDRFVINIKGETYAKLCIVVFSLFNTFFFLAGVPKFDRSDAQRNLDDEEETPYPKGLKIFSANLLLPLVVLYLTILYIYSIKILIEWEWPQGWIGWLVLSFSVLGILALLLLWPLSRRQENGWIPRFTRWFYLAIFPLIGLLFAAIFRRIAEYGITENRYFVLALAVWLAGISLYFLLSKKKNIKVIPASLAFLSFLTSFGPWSAFAVSTRSQLGRFEGYLQKNEMLVDGVIDTTGSKSIADEDRKEMSSIIYYLNERDEVDRLQRFLPEGKEVAMAKFKYERAERIATQFGVNLYDTTKPVGEPETSFLLKLSDSPEVEVIRGFDLLIPSSNYFVNESSEEPILLTEFSFEGESYRLNIEPNDFRIDLLSANRRLITVSLDPALRERIVREENVSRKNLRGDNSDGASDGESFEKSGSGSIILEGANSLMRMRLQIVGVGGSYRWSDSGEIDMSSIKLSHIEMMVLVGGMTSESEVEESK